SGFPDATGLTLVPDLPPPNTTRTPKATKQPTTNRDDVETDARAAVAAQKEAAREAADIAEADADAAQARVDELERELGLARRELTAARARSRKAKSTLRDLR